MPSSFHRSLLRSRPSSDAVVLPKPSFFRSRRSSDAHDHDVQALPAFQCGHSDNGQHFVKALAIVAAVSLTRPRGAKGISRLR